MRLPGLSSLRAFEAAARHLSFTRAAAELNVLPPAISRQVAELEADLGTKLFIRSKPRVSLTSDGQAFYTSVSAGFSEITKSAGILRTRAEKPPLIVDVSIGIASCWLMARLADFGMRYPDVEIKLVTRDSNAGFNQNESDLVVLFGEKALPGISSVSLFTEALIPICSPDYLPEGKMLSIEELAGESLLFLSGIYHQADWNLFFEPFGLKPPPPKPGTEFNSFIVYLQAAINGDGIGLSWRYMMDDMIEARRLRLASEVTVLGTRGYHCCTLERGQNKPEAKFFSDWISGICPPD